jgi:opacity protein-like surface antigen
MNGAGRAPGVAREGRAGGAGRQWLITIIAACVAVVAAPRAARADGFVTPFIGVNFSGATGGALVNAVEDSSKLTYGVSIGFMGGGVIGLEEDFAYAPKFVAAGAGVGQTNVLTLMTNLIIGIPVGGQKGGGIRPYVLGGIGLLRTTVENSIEVLVPDRNSVGFDLGGGLNIYFADNVGIRGDLRYFRDFSVADVNNALGVTLGRGRLDFWRGSAGLVLRF